MNAERVLSRSASIRQQSVRMRSQLAESSPPTRALRDRDVPVAGEPSPRDPAIRLVAITFSAGGIKPLLQVLRGFPRNLAAAVAVTHHSGEASCLPDVLRNQTPIPVKFAEDGEVVRDATTYICPPQHHLVLNPDGTLCLSSNPRVNRMRPSADWFLRSVAGAYGNRAIAALLSGAASDGAAGAAAVLDAGGHVIVQAPDSALYPALPRAVLNARPGCVVEPPAAIASRILQMLEARNTERVRLEWEDPFGPGCAA